MTFIRLLMVSLPLALAGIAVAAPDNELPEPISRVLDWQNLSRADVSLWVQPVDGGPPLLELNADVPRNPASVTKLPVSFAALEVLGPAYTWKTELYVDKAPRDGVLAGDLWIRGGGDPYLVAEEMWKLVGALRQTGIRRIEGDLILDDSHFDIVPRDPAAFDNEPFRAYNQQPHPFLVNFNVLSFHVWPDNEGGGIRVQANPPLPGLTLENRLRPASGPCAGFQRGVSYHVPAPGHVVLEGRHPTACNGYRLNRVALPPEEYAYRMFKMLWEQWGGEFDGGWRRGVRAVSDEQPLLVHESRPLGELIRLANKYSSNVMTRHFKLALGVEVYGEPATESKGNAAILRHLADRGVDVDGIRLDNAAGLSRNNRFTARQIAATLAAARESRYMPEFVSSLALSGMDGTVRRRFRDEAEAGHMHLKTGRLDHVSAVAGYVRTLSGRDLAVVVLVNAEDAHRGPGEALQDAVLRWAYRQ